MPDGHIDKRVISFYPVLFAVPRCVGWLAHWRQQMLNPSGVKIWRPRQLYVGKGERDYVGLESRQSSDGGTFGAPTRVSHGGDSKRNRLATFTNERGDTSRPKL